jgi:hypothetical protein
LKNIKIKNKMAFVSTNSQIKKNILNYISRLVSKTLYRSIEILFKPCCDITITNVEVDCSSVTSGNYDITITLDKSINMLGNGLLLVLVDGVVVTVDGGGLIPYNDSNKIVLLDSDIGDSSGGSKGVTVLFLLPGAPLSNATDFSQLTPGVFTLASSDLDFSFPSCP